VQIPPPEALRRLFVSDSGSDNDEDESQAASSEGAWKLGQEGPLGKPSGKLPGVYDSYMLIRPAPSLRIIFASSKLQKQAQPVQSPFLSHVAAPPRTLAGLKESFLAGVPVSAKINFMSSPGERRDGLRVGSDYKHEDGKYGKACWISATPLLGSDDRPGVWMVVFVERSKVPKTGMTRSAEIEAKTEAGVGKTSKPDSPKSNRPDQKATDQKQPDVNNTAQPRKEMPIKPKRLDDVQTAPAESNTNALAVASDAETEDYHEAESEHLKPADHSSEMLTEAPQPASLSHTALVQPKPKPVSGTQTPNIESMDRVVVTPSSDHEKEQREFEQQHKQSSSATAAVENPDQQQPLIRQRSDTGYESTTPKLRLDLQQQQQQQLQRKFTPPPDIDHSMLSQTPRTEEGERTEMNGRTQPQDNGSSEDLENTPVATRTHTRRSSGEGKMSRSGPKAVQSPVREYQEPEDAKGDDGQGEEVGEDEDWEPVSKERPGLQRDPNGPSGLAIDYLAHPGSGRKRVSAEEFGRALQEKGGKQGDDGDDSDCLRTPYSVD
jgi:hypothetical protein